VQKLLWCDSLPSTQAMSWLVAIHHPFGASGLMSSPRKRTKLLSHLTSVRKQHLIDGTLAVVMYFVAQLLIWGVDAVITLAGKTFPGPIVAMILVWLVMLVIGWCWDGLADTYAKFLKGPVWSCLNETNVCCRLTDSLLENHRPIYSINTCR
jgi:hypothetical protein